MLILGMIIYHHQTPQKKAIPWNVKIGSQHSPNEKLLKNVNRVKDNKFLSFTSVHDKKTSIPFCVNHRINIKILQYDESEAFEPSILEKVLVR